MEKPRPSKTKYDGNIANKTAPKKCKLSKDSILFKSFSLYQQQLDIRNDKYERLVKLSRDITIQSKRTIFSLLRREETLTDLLKDGEEKVEAIKKLLQTMCNELKNEDPYRFARAISPGIQEFIEAVSLMFYIKDKRVISYDHVNNLYFSYEGETVLLTHSDYMLGIADLTGELMRMAINRIGSREFNEAEDICGVLRSIYREYAIFAADNRELSKKLGVMKASMQKVENACYNVKVRGSEVPDDMLANIGISIEQSHVD